MGSADGQQPLAGVATHAHARTRPALETAWAISTVLTVSYCAAGFVAGAVPAVQVVTSDAAQCFARPCQRICGER